ncbi:MAG: hypothetical protein PHE73_08815 [Sulfurovaceae bacterium]|nr:hypothetical protein [Sulfurovaceae bacterium]
MLKKLTVGDVNDPAYGKSVEHTVVRLGKGMEYPDGVLMFFVRQFDDLLINSPDGNVLIDWDNNHETTDLDENHCLLVTQKDGLKEIGNIRSTLIAFKSQDSEKAITVYVTIQRN